MNYQRKFLLQIKGEFIKDCEKLNPEKDKKGFNTGLFTNCILLLRVKNSLFIWLILFERIWIRVNFGCPTHDQRDLDFANEYNLDVIPVVKPDNIEMKDFEIKMLHLPKTVK